jgi:hypothetical protein
MIRSGTLRVVAVAGMSAAVVALPGTAQAALRAGHAPQSPAGLTVGDQARPLNVEGAPLFGWTPRDRDPGEVQSAYEIVVRDASGKTVWDSGRVRSGGQEYVKYAGPALAPETSYTWTVRTWDRTGERSPWARPAAFDTGLADRDWQATWIRRTTGEADDYTLARKDFTVGDSKVVRARVHIAAGQQYALHLNGETVDHGPAFEYPDDGYYRTVDVAPKRNGDAGDYVEDIDGTAARLGWDQPGHDASSWQDAQVAGVHPTAVFKHLKGQETALAYRTVRPVKVTRLDSGALVADFGKVIPAVPVVAVTAPASAAVRIRPPLTGLDRASGTVPLQRGDVGVTWKRQGQGFSLAVDVPVNVRAEIHVPARSVHDVHVSGTRGRERGGARFTGMKDGYAVFEAGSGHLTFRSDHR